MAPRFECLLLGDQTVDHREVWAMQRRPHAEVCAGAEDVVVLLLEHSPAYTAGKRTLPPERPATQPVIDVDRGGKITHHGPGQL